MLNIKNFQLAQSILKTHPVMRTVVDNFISMDYNQNFKAFCLAHEKAIVERLKELLKQQNQEIIKLADAFGITRDRALATNDAQNCISLAVIEAVRDNGGDDGPPRYELAP